MIRLFKVPVPQVLARRGEEWTAEYVRRLQSGGLRKDLPARYRHADVKAALRIETKDKCGWCESFVGHAQFGDIDHYVPVSLSPELVVCWSNLGYACEKCNTNKADYWDDLFPLINPYTEEPSQFLTFGGPFAVHHPGNMRGKITIERIGLEYSATVAAHLARFMQGLTTPSPRS